MKALATSPLPLSWTIFTRTQNANYYAKLNQETTRWKGGEEKTQKQ